MKKILSLLLVFALMLSFAACGGKNKPEEPNTQAPTVKTTVNIATLKGPSGVALVKIKEDAENGKAQNDYKFSLLDNPNDAVAGLVSGAYDIASVPVNMASVLFNKLKGNIQLLAADTKGVLYVLEQGNTIKSVKDLEGKTIYATGQGSTPEYIFDYILRENGLLGKVKVEYKSTHDELLTLVAAGEIALSILPEPKVTVATMKNSKLRVALNLTEEFEKASGKKLIMGVVVARKDFADNNPDAVKAFMEEYKASVNYTSANLDDTANLCEKHGIIPKAPMAKVAIPKCNLEFIDGANMKDSVKTILQLFYDADAKSIGGKMPDDVFYYGA